MRDSHYAMKQLCRRNREGSKATQANRERIGHTCVNDLRTIGFRDLDIRNLKPKHVEALADYWIGQELSPGTLKNRMAFLRWWAEKIGKENIVARSNDEYGIPDRQYVATISNAKELEMDKLNLIASERIKISLRLQAAFGLRREESIKIHPKWADQGGRLRLKASWTKGGRPRDIPIRTQAQRQLVDEAKAVANGRSQIPPEYARYIDYLEHFRYRCGRAGIHAFHGHRHFYAQTCYRELTGWACPVQGGPTAKQLTPEQKTLDRAARLTISQEMGHGREQITTVYLGR